MQAYPRRDPLVSATKMISTTASIATPIPNMRATKLLKFDPSSRLTSLIKMAEDFRDCE